MKLIDWILRRMRSHEVNAALEESRQNLESVMAEREEMAPELARLRKYVERNHFEEAVRAIFRVAR